MDDNNGESDTEYNDERAVESVDYEVDLEEAAEVTPDNPEDVTDEEHFDITLAASHSYMGDDLQEVNGCSILESGWEGKIPVLAHHGTVFPGETVPMLLADQEDTALLLRAIKRDNLFGLLCPDESGSRISGYGVLCAVFEMGVSGELSAPAAVTFKARANQRFRFKCLPKISAPIHTYSRIREVQVVVLPELTLGEPLRDARLASLDRLRRHPKQERAVRALDASLSGWPRFVYDMFDARRMRNAIREYFNTIMMDKLPEEPVSLSFWVASNLVLSPRDRLALFVVDNALQRLHMELQFISRKSALCCAGCSCEIARRDHVFAMSSDGVHSNYTNLGGFVHDLVTVSRASNTVLSGSASAEFSWFPGYTWTIALCASCMAHVGWRFDAMRRSLRPQQFFGLCRNYVQPRGDDDAHDALATTL